jgi:hypothetical protein
MRFRKACCPRLLLIRCSFRCPAPPGLDLYFVPSNFTIIEHELIIIYTYHLTTPRRLFSDFIVNSAIYERTQIKLLD